MPVPSLRMILFVCGRLSGRLQCHSFPTRVNDQEGGYEGKVVAKANHNLSPDGVAWTWQQCSQMCLNYDGYRAGNGLPGKDEFKCAYFLVSAQRGCVLKSSQGAFKPNSPSSTVLSHGTCTEM